MGIVRIILHLLIIPHLKNTEMLPDEGRRLQRPKRCINNNQDEDTPNNTTTQKYK